MRADRGRTWRNFAIAIPVAAISVWSSSGTAELSQQPAPAGQQPAGGRQGGGGRGPAPLNLEDRAGFEPIFDGRSLKGWDGDPAYWKVENGSIVGESTEANPVKENTFLIWRGGEPADFELKLQFRMNATNSGVQFRSVHLPQGTESGRGAIAGKWVLKGYQADIDFENRYTGMIYEERGPRGFLAPRGVASYIGADGNKKTIGNLELSPEALKAIIKTGDWNDVHIVARGNVLVNILNGHVTAMVIDDDPKDRTMKGLIGFQIHMGPPMKIEFKNIYLKKL
jgi:3-keto-disaccharide hydrolase